MTAPVTIQKYHETLTTLNNLCLGGNSEETIRKINSHYVTIPRPGVVSTFSGVLATVVSPASYALLPYINMAISKELKILGSLGMGAATLVGCYIKGYREHSKKVEQQQVTQQKIEDAFRVFSTEILPNVAKQMAVDLTSIPLVWECKELDLKAENTMVSIIKEAVLNYDHVGHVDPKPLLLYHEKTSSVIAEDNRKFFRTVNLIVKNIDTVNPDLIFEPIKAAFLTVQKMTDSFLKVTTDHTKLITYTSKWNGKDDKDARVECTFTALNISLA